MTPSALFYLVGRRLRTHPVQEFLTGVGIAIGVALAFATLVANASVVGSANEIVHGVTGSANLQLQGRDPRGFDQDMLSAVRAIPGVELAAPLLEARAVLEGSRGRAPVDLASSDPSLATLSGRLTRLFAVGAMSLGNAALPTRGVADRIGLPDPSQQAVARPLPFVRVIVGGRAHRLPVPFTLGTDSIGPLSGAMVAVIPLAHLQRLLGMPNRITRILVRTAPGKESFVRGVLRGLARGRLTVTPADQEVGLLREAVRASGQATTLFAVLSALLGFLLAFNAMLLTAPERRRIISTLRMQGWRPRTVVVLMMSQAVFLGLAGSAVGVTVGEILARGIFHESPGYLSPAFTLGTGTVIGAAPIVVAVLGGVAASCLAAAPPLLDLRRKEAVDAVFRDDGVIGNVVSVRARRYLLIAAVAAAISATAIYRAVPELALAACALLALTTVCAIPTTFTIVLRIAEAVSERAERFASLTFSLLALRATTLRALALAATGAVAVFGSVALGGARADLLRGIAAYTRDYVGTADLWIANPLDNQATNPIPADLARQVRAIPGVAAVREYYGGFLDVGRQRIWIIARPPGDRTMVAPSQLLHGDLATADGRIRTGPWIAVSQQLAAERHVAVGGSLSLPTPSGRASFRVAAITTNLGWAPGAVTMAAGTYRAAWPGAPPTALEVDTNANSVHVGAAIRRVLGRDNGLVVQTAAQRAVAINASAREGLSRLKQIGLLLLVAAVVAMASAMGAAIWQRRPALAMLQVHGTKRILLWLILLIESTVVLGAGCATGALIGIYGQTGIDAYLQHVTGFPVEIVVGGTAALTTFALVLGAALLTLAIPGWIAARVPAHIGLGEITAPKT